MQYDVDIDRLEILWSPSDGGFRRRLARITFAFTSPMVSLPDFELPIMLDAQLEADSLLVERAWAKLHDRLGEARTSAEEGAARSRSDVRRDLCEV